MSKPQQNNVQDIPTPDSTHNEPFESIVELYYQTQGYITSSNKWFRCSGGGGNRDIDVLAVNGNETLIISVTVNLKSKVTSSAPKLNLLKYFDLVEEYLKNVPEYSWLVKDRKVRKILVYESGYREKTNKLIKDKLAKVRIKLISPNEIIEAITEYVRCTQEGWEGNNLKTNNPLVMLVRLFRTQLKQKDETAKMSLLELLTKE